MNRPSDLDARLSAWLGEGPTSGPEEVLSRTFARARSTRQDRGWLYRLTPPLRFQPMYATLKIAAVSVLALAVVIVIDPLRPPAPYGAADPSPTPVPSPTEPVLLPLSSQPLEPGTYRLGSPIGAPDSPISRITATVPQGWTGIRGNTFANLFQDADAFPEGSVGLSLPSDIFIDPCDIDAGKMDPPLGPTVDDYVTAMANVPGYTMTDPTDITFQGYSGKYIEVIGPPSVAECADGFSHPWETQYNETAMYDFDDQHSRQWVLDIDGARLLLFLTGTNAAPHPTGTDPVSLAEQQAVFDSIRIAPLLSPVESPPASSTP